MPEMPGLIDRDAALKLAYHNYYPSIDHLCFSVKCATYDELEALPTIEAEPVRHGRWIECDYKHMEHGMIETEPKAGLCCSECRAAFQKKKMTYKQYCAACGALMDKNESMFAGTFSQCDNCPDWDGVKCKSDCHGCEEGGPDNG